MINNIHIKNFKSVQDLQLPLGRFNVLIGENGSGKSNILEAIAFAGADAADKLDYEFLSSRGIRPTTDAKHLKSAFNKIFLNEDISINFEFDNDKSFEYLIKEDIETTYPKWIDNKKKFFEKKEIDSWVQYFDSRDIENIKDFNDEQKIWALNIQQKIKAFQGNKDSNEISNLIRKEFAYSIRNAIKDNFFNSDIATFIIYAPENSSIRQTESESQIQPLGIKGEGLFNLLQSFSNENTNESIDELKKFLHVIDWFDDFEMLKDQVSGKKYIQVRDRYLKQNIVLNQSNVNEGFLFLLFYISLFISNETPSFFAIDNLESSFHPRLCIELTKRLIELAQKHNKQVIVTTHNPYILDGLDLNDQDQKLFVIRRDPDGETIADHIKEPLKGLKLSQGWMRGVIGGQPQTIE